MILKRWVVFFLKVNLLGEKKILGFFPVFSHMIWALGMRGIFSIYQTSTQFSGGHQPLSDKSHQFWYCLPEDHVDSTKIRAKSEKIIPIWMPIVSSRRFYQCF